MKLFKFTPMIKLGQTKVYITLGYTFQVRSRIFLPNDFFARHYSLPPRQITPLISHADCIILTYGILQNRFGIFVSSKLGSDTHCKLQNHIQKKKRESKKKKPRQDCHKKRKKMMQCKVTLINFVTVVRQLKVIITSF